MAIQPINSGNVANSVATAKPTGKNAADTQNQAVGSAVSDDTVSITNGISKAAGDNDSPPVVDQNRVASLKAAIQSGDYKINPEQIASKMMAFDKQLRSDTT